jgi:hypothetical protein
MEPGKTPKMDKSAILNDAIRVVSELRSEAQKLKDSSESLQEKIKELKVYPVSYGLVFSSFHSQRGYVSYDIYYLLFRHSIYTVAIIFYDIFICSFLLFEI